MFQSALRVEPPLSAASLRRDLNARAAVWARRLGVHHELTTGRSPGVIFGPGPDDAQPPTHGNFHPASYRAILKQPEWARRLAKAHTASVRAYPRSDWRWRELDCAGSSDALLMNIFCHPATLRDGRVAALLGVSRAASLVFGVRPRIPLANGLFDTTEIDMQVGGLMIEAKLTESNFQTARPALVMRYSNLEEVFDLDLLPRTRQVVVDQQWDEEQASMLDVVRGSAGHFASYQLIRGALAAHVTGSTFCVLADNRRADLVEAWFHVLRAVHSAELRSRLQLLTWQELAAALPADLQHFLKDKYGIASDPACSNLVAHRFEAKA